MLRAYGVFNYLTIVKGTSWQRFDQTVIQIRNYTWTNNCHRILPQAQYELHSSLECERFQNSTQSHNIKVSLPNPLHIGTDDAWTDDLDYN